MCVWLLLPRERALWGQPRDSGTRLSSLRQRGRVSQVGLGCVCSLGQRRRQSCSLEEHVARSREAGWIPAPERGTFEEHVRLGACSVSVPLWACSRRCPPSGAVVTLVHVRCRPCLPDLTAVHVGLPVTLWGARGAGTERLLSRCPSRTRLTHFQTLKRRESQLHSIDGSSGILASVSFARTC